MKNNYFSKGRQRYFWDWDTLNNLIGNYNGVYGSYDNFNASINDTVVAYEGLTLMPEHAGGQDHMPAHPQILFHSYPGYCYYEKVII